MACGRTIRKGLERLVLSVIGRIALGLVIFSAAIAAPPFAAAAPLRVEVKVEVNDSYARLVFSANQVLDATIHQSGSVLIISFKQATDIPVDRIAEQARDFIAAVRRDPDGKAIRLALTQKLTAHSIAADEKFFVDLLPDGWTGPPPGLPADVVDDLARRARDADRIMQSQQPPEKKVASARVQVASAPTFTRYAFDVPDQTSVSADRGKDRLVLKFDVPIKFDLADAAAALPAVVQAIDSTLDSQSSSVRFTLAAPVDIRTFRDGRDYVVDIVNPDGEGEAPEGAPAAGVKHLPAPPAGAAGENTPADAVAAAARKLSEALEKPPVGNSSPNDAPVQAAPAPPLEAAAIPPPPAPPSPVEASHAKRQATPETPDPQDHPASPTGPTSSPATAAPASTAPSEGGGAPSAPPAGESAAGLQDKSAAPAKSTPATPAAAAAPPKASQVSSPPPTDQRADASAPGSDQKRGASPAGVAVPQTPASPPNPAPGAMRSDRTAAKLAVELAHQGDNLKLTFPFDGPVAAAVFTRADTLWIVFDSQSDIDLSALDGEIGRTVRAYDLRRTPDAAIVRVKLERPQLASVVSSGPGWSVEIGDTVSEPARALEITRNVASANRASVTIPIAEPHRLHHVADADTGDELLVVTVFPPARGLIHTQDFVEFHALASTLGVVIEPLADDIRVDLSPDKVVVGRPAGLTLSSSLQPLLRGGGLRPMMLDQQAWGSDREGSFPERQSNLLAAAAAAPEQKRMAPRLDLARFYLARDMYPEAKGVLDVALAGDRAGTAAGVSAMVMRAIAEVMMYRPDDALKDLADPAVGDQHNALLWRALAYARQGKWAQAHDAFRTTETALTTLPIELQRVALNAEMRSAIEVGDFASASANLDDFKTIGVPQEMEPALSVLIGRLAEGTGRTDDALAAYQSAADSSDRPAAAQAQLRLIALRYSLGDLDRGDAINQLETLTTIWRGDETEIEALKLLAHLYTEEKRYRDAFYVMRSAMAAHPSSELTRQIQSEAAATFDQLFLAGAGDALPAIDALALFYDFRELTPVGRRGDEMIRHLADRLVSVDLLDQASDLLQYQIDHRLEGAARAQVATRLAVIYLMNRKPDRALAVLRASRSGNLSNELRNQRLLLEARALSDLGRHEVALEVIANIEGNEAIRLRSDIYWAARRWRESAEQIELMYGERWKQWQPLSDVERQDILRAEIGYALAEDSLGLGRLREKYAPKMAGTPDAHAFDIVSAPLGASGNEFASIAHAAAAVDTLEAFLRDMQARYPESGAAAPAKAMDGAPAAAQDRPAAPDTRPLPPAPVPPSRAAGRTAQR